MAVLIASDLGKDMAGTPLLRGVSFKLERRDRLTIAGRNGAGKTTLLRMLAGETSVDGGELVFGKGARVALHDQRPPRDRELTLRDYVPAGARGARRARGTSWRASRRRWPTATRRRIDAYARARRGSSTPAATPGASARRQVQGLGFGDAELDRQLATFSGGELTRASLARALVAEPDLLLLDEPTNHLDIESLEWLEQALSRSTPRSSWSPTTAGSSRPSARAVLELEAGRGRFFPARGRVAPGGGGARDRARPGDRQAAGRDRRMERFVERFRYKATKARQAQSRVKALDKIERIERDPRDNRELGF